MPDPASSPQRNLIPQQFYSSAMTWTVATGATATILVAAALNKVFGVPEKYSGFVFAVALAVGIMLKENKKPPFSDFLVAILNGCLIFMSAAGATGIGSSISLDTPRASEQGRPALTKPLVRSWFQDQGLVSYTKAVESEMERVSTDLDRVRATAQPALENLGVELPTVVMPPATANFLARTRK